MGTGVGATSAAPTPFLTLLPSRVVVRVTIVLGVDAVWRDLGGWLVERNHVLDETRRIVELLRRLLAAGGRNLADETVSVTHVASLRIYCREAADEHLRLESLDISHDVQNIVLYVAPPGTGLDDDEQFLLIVRSVRHAVNHSNLANVLDDAPHDERCVEARGRVVLGLTATVALVHAHVQLRAVQEVGVQIDQHAAPLSLSNCEVHGPLGPQCDYIMI